MKNTSLIFYIIILYFFLSNAASASEAPSEELSSQGYYMAELEFRFKNLEAKFNEFKSSYEDQEKTVYNNLMREDGVSEDSMSYSDWAAITLACVAVLVTVLGVLIAILSVWGYNNIAREAKNSAESVSNDASSRIAKLQVESCINDIAKEELIKLIDTGELRKHLEDAVDLIYRNHALTEGLRDGFGKYPELDEKRERE